MVNFNCAVFAVQNGNKWQLNVSYIYRGGCCVAGIKIVFYLLSALRFYSITCALRCIVGVLVKQVMKETDI